MILSEEILLKLIRAALGNENSLSLPWGIDWNEVIELSYQQGVAAIAVDGLQQIYDANTEYQTELDNPELEDLKYDWFGSCLMNEKDYEALTKSIKHLAKFLSSHNIPMMLLKGFGLSLNYPNPSHRPTGDIDIYLWDLWKAADEYISSELCANIDNSHHHHSVYKFEGFSVENHYDFVNINSHFSNRKIEETFKRLANDLNATEEHILPNAVKIYFPSPDLNALFIARHCAIHFAAEGMNLRQLLDWALFVSNHHQKVDWDMFWTSTQQMGMVKFVLCMNEIAVSRLGFKREDFHQPDSITKEFKVDNKLVDCVLNDILNPEKDVTHGKNPINYIWARFKLWWHNRWKHRIVYSDSLLSTFIAQIKSHLMKPATIKGC